jgi:hypothetical protein
MPAEILTPQRSGAGTGVTRPPSQAARLRPPAGRQAGLPALARAVARHVAVVLAFAVPAVALWWHAWAGHLGSTLTCACGDAGQEVWFVAWPAYALAHGFDPFFSGALQAPYGVNLLDNAGATPVGIALAPLTWAAGPIVSTNVALTLCPALSAWACWLTCRRLVGWWPAAALAGLVFGYSPFVVTNTALGHVSLCLLVVPPLLVLAAREILVGPEEKRARWGAAAGALVGLQFLISSEVLAIVVVVGLPAAALVLLAVRPPRRPVLRALVRPLLVSGAVAALLLAFPVWFFLAGAQHLHGPLWPGADVRGNFLSSLWSPGAFRAAATTLTRLGGYEGLRGPPSAYLGPLVLGAFVASVVLAGRRRTTAILALTGMLAGAFSLGAILYLSPKVTSGVWTPWRLFGSWPLLEDVIPQRFSALADLCVALVIGLGLDRAHHLVARRAGLRSRRTRAAAPSWVATVAVFCVAASVGSLWWTYQVPMATESVSLPRWFRTAALTLPEGTTVLTYPFPFPSEGVSQPMVWQAVDGMRFRLAGGYVKVPNGRGMPLGGTQGRQPYALLGALSGAAAGPLPAGVSPAARRALRAAIRRWRVDVVVVTGRGRDPSLAAKVFADVLGSPPRRQDGASVWELRD